MDLLDYTGIKSLSIEMEACKRLCVPQVRTKTGIKFAAVFSENCYKILSVDGSYSWYGDYEPNLGLFGQKAAPVGKPIIIVTSEFEVLKLASLGFNSAVCLAEPKHLDPVTFSILSEGLGQVCKQIWVWQGADNGPKNKALEAFLLHLAGNPQFNVVSIDGSNLPILTSSKGDIKDILEDITLKPWKPKGLMKMEEVLESNAFKQPVIGCTTGYECIDRMNGGIRRGEVTLFTAGSGVGKSTIVREIAYHLGTVENQKVGMIFLEEKVDRTAKCLAAIKYDIPVDMLRRDSSLLSEKEWKEFKSDQRIRENFVFYNHFGSLDSEELFQKIDYMINFERCSFICLDHISIVVSGMSSKEGERKDIDILMTKLATCAVAKDTGFLIISHLNVPEGQPHEEGGRVTMSNLRGSGSIKQLCWSIFALERNQQDPSDTYALLRELKNREMGKTGPCGVLKYYPETGRLKEAFDVSIQDMEERFKSAKKQGRSGNGGRGNYNPKTSFGSKDY